MVSPSVRRRFLQCLCLSVVGTIAQDDIPSVDSFYRASKWRGECYAANSECGCDRRLTCRGLVRHCTKATMIDDYLYIDGGEVSQKGFTEPRESNSSKSWLLLEPPCVIWVEVTESLHYTLT